MLGIEERGVVLQAAEKHYRNWQEQSLDMLVLVNPEILNVWFR